MFSFHYAQLQVYSWYEYASQNEWSDCLKAAELTNACESTTIGRWSPMAPRNSRTRIRHSIYLSIAANAIGTNAPSLRSSIKIQALNLVTSPYAWPRGAMNAFEELTKWMINLSKLKSQCFEQHFQGYNKGTTKIMKWGNLDIQVWMKQESLEDQHLQR